MRARLTSWIDMMLSPPSAKKLSSMPDPIEPQHLGEQRAQDLLLRGARRAHRRGGQIRRRQRLPVELAVGVSGSRSNTTNAAGTM